MKSLRPVDPAVCRIRNQEKHVPVQIYFSHRLSSPLSLQNHSRHDTGILGSISACNTIKLVDTKYGKTIQGFTLQICKFDSGCRQSEGWHIDMFNARLNDTICPARYQSVLAFKMWVLFCCSFPTKNNTFYLFKKQQVLFRLFKNRNFNIIQLYYYKRNKRDIDLPYLNLDNLCYINFSYNKLTSN